MLSEVGSCTNYPLSFSQMGAWRRGQGNGPAHQYTTLFRLNGGLNIAALEHGLQELVRHQEVLRTTYEVRDSAPVQVIHGIQSFALRMIDLSSLPEAAREGKARELAAAETGSNFDLSQDLMLRATLMRLHDEQHFLLLVAHEVAWDIWSTGIAIRELFAFYDGAAAPAPCGPPRECLENDRPSGATRLLESPAGGRHRDADVAGEPAKDSAATYRGQTETLRLPYELSEQVKSLARQEQVSLDVVLLSGFQALLHRYTGNQTIVVGGTINNRSGEMERLVGPFSNRVAVRTKLSGATPFRGVIAHVRDVVAGAQANGQIPFEKVAEALDLKASLIDGTYFQVTFRARPSLERMTTPSGLEVEEEDFDAGASVCDLALEVREDAEGIRCALTCNAELFDAEVMQRMLRHYERLLRAIAANPDRLVCELPILTDEERHRVLVEWNDTSEDIPQRSVSQLFEEQAHRTPDAIAVTYEDQQVTYSELNARANGLAHKLLNLGVKPGEVVAVCLERSVEMLIGLLATLKAGGGYLPLDPAHPAQRWAFMLSDSQARVLLCNRRMTSQLTGNEAAVLPLEEWGDIASDKSNENPPCTLGPDDLAYVLYTSGSTGKPKGVLVSQRALVNLLCSMRRWFDFKPDDILLGRYDYFLRHCGD